MSNNIDLEFGRFTDEYLNNYIDRKADEKLKKINSIEKFVAIVRQYQILTRILAMIVIIVI